MAEKDNEARVHIAGRMFPVLLSGLDMLENEQCGPGSERVVIYGILPVFLLALECLQQFSTVHAGRTSTQKSPRKKQNMAASESSPVKADMDTMEFRFSRLFVPFMASLSPQSQTHSQVMVGAMCLLLWRIGEALNSVGFGSERLEQERAAVAPLPSTSSRLNLKEDVKSTEDEGPYLIWIPERVLALWH